MVYLHIKSEERTRAEAYVGRVFGADRRIGADREAVECITARTEEAYKELKRRDRE